MTNRKQQRENKNKNRDGMGGNKPPKPLAKAADCGVALTVEADASAKLKGATANRFRTFLMVTTSDPDVAEKVRVHYKQSLAPAQQTAEIRQRVRAEKNVLFSIFGVPSIPDEVPEGEAAEVTKKRVQIQNTCIKTLALCYAVETKGYASSFDFPAEGGSFINYDTPLGKHLWSTLKVGDKTWDNDDTMKERRADKGERDIRIVQNTWQKMPGHPYLVWADIVTAIVGVERPGQATQKKRDIVSNADTPNAIQKAANYTETDPPKNVEGIRGALENAKRIVVNTLASQPTVQDKMPAFISAVDALINMFAKNTGKLEMPEGVVVKMATPESAKDLPEGTPNKQAS